MTTTTAGAMTTTLTGPVLFKAACPDCRGSFELSSDALRLAIGATRRTTFYSFTCPDCGSAVRKPAGSGSSNCSRGRGADVAGAPWVTAPTRPPPPKNRSMSHFSWDPSRSRPR